jgi:hypothetical protein
MLQGNHHQEATMTRTDFDGYGITELRRHARELNIPGRSTMTGPELLTAVTGAWDARRVAAEREVMPAVRPGAFLRYKTHTDCVIKVTSGVRGWTDLVRRPHETTPLYVEAEYVSMCSNCDHGKQGGPVVTDKWRMDYHNASVTGANGYRPYRFLLWSLEPAGATQTADAMQREARVELRPGDLVVRTAEPNGPIGTVVNVTLAFALVRFGDLAEHAIRREALTKVPARTVTDDEISAGAATHADDCGIFLGHFGRMSWDRCTCAARHERALAVAR